MGGGSGERDGLDDTIPASMGRVVEAFDTVWPWQLTTHR
jgi:hypothetical protein